jgi:glycosyltransferase involved in cell wall biosynthesis
MLLAPLAARALRGVIGLPTAVWVVVFTVWALTYLAVNRLTGGHLDWALRIRYRWLRWSAAASAVVTQADVWHGHDMSALRAALLAQRRSGGRLVYDSHEILLESSAYVSRPRPLRSVLRAIEREWVRRVDAVVTVNDMVASELDARYRPERIVVTHNCPPRPQYRGPNRRDYLRRACGVPRGTPLVVYHGGLAVHRGIEQMLEALTEPGMEGVHGVLMGYGPMRDAYATLASEPRFGGRVHVLDAVDPSLLVEWLSTADVAVMAIQPSTLNHRLCTPNKLFEALAAGVPVVGSDFAGFTRVVRDNPSGPLGILCDPTDPVAIAAGIRDLLALAPAERVALRARCRRAAAELWNWETEEHKLVALYDELLRLPARAIGRPPTRRAARRSSPRETESLAA